MYLKTYVAFARRAFLSKSAYRFDHFMGIFQTCLQIFIFWSIYKALYGGNNEVSGISFSMVTTHFVLSIGLSTAFRMNDLFIPKKIRDGTIANELLRPVKFKYRILFENLGEIGFSLLFHFLPALLIVSVTIGMEKPISVFGFFCFLISTVLGLFILWNISFVVQTLAFWIMNVWSVSTIKNVLVNVLSGLMFPLWFMPAWMEGVIRFTPFSSIYFTPIQIYLGDISGREVILRCSIQIVWIVLIGLLGESLWRKGQEKLVVQGG